VDREADGAGAAVGGPAGDRLADPPAGVGRELEPQPPVELLHRPHQAQVALLDHVAQRQAGPGAPAGDGHHQAQVALDHPALGRVVTGLDRLGQLDLLLAGQQPVPARLVQVHPEQVKVVGRRRHRLLAPPAARWSTQR
jgi:hypothetical protein